MTQGSHRENWREWWRDHPPAQLAVILASALLLVVVFIDGPVLQFARETEPGVRRVIANLTLIGDSGWSLLLSLAAALILGFAARRAGMRDRPVLRFMRGQALFLFTAVLASGATVSFAKHLIGRARPAALDPPRVLAIEPAAFDAPWASFPSGHATTAMALAVGLGLLCPRYRTAFLCVGLWAAFSRALLGAHWLSDVLAGIVWGLLGAWLVWRRFAPRGIGFRPPGRAAPAPVVMLGALGRVSGAVWRDLRAGSARLPGLPPSLLPFRNHKDRP